MLWPSQCPPALQGHRGGHQNEVGRGDRVCVGGCIRKEILRLVMQHKQELVEEREGNSFQAESSAARTEAWPCSSGICRQAVHWGQREDGEEGTRAGHGSNGNFSKQENMFCSNSEGAKGLIHGGRGAKRWRLLCSIRLPWGLVGAEHGWPGKLLNRRTLPTPERGASS